MPAPPKRTGMRRGAVRTVLSARLALQLDAFLRSSRDLNRLCTQNGWIDTDSLCYEVLAHHGQCLTLKVQFDEILMEGAGCIAGRVPCYGRLQVHVDAAGAVTGMDIVAGQVDEES